MNNKQVRKTRWITPRRLTAMGCLLGVAALAAFVLVFYQQVRKLGGTGETPQVDIAGMQDFTVRRDTVLVGVQIFGSVQAAREETLGFRLARAEVSAVLVSPGQTVKAGDELVLLDTTFLESELAQARADLLQARKQADEWSGLALEAQRLNREIELRDAREALDKAQRELVAYDAGQDAPKQERATAAADLERTKAVLAALRDSRERKDEIAQLQVLYNEAEVKHGEMVVIPNPSEQDRDVEWLLRNEMLDRSDVLEQAKLRYAMDIRAAEQAVIKAERALRDIENQIAGGSSAVERELKRAAISAAQAQVQQAEARLDASKSDVPNADAARAQAAVLKLEGTVSDAEAALAEARLTAPFDATVDQVLAITDTMISGSAPVVTLLDLSAVRIVASVSDVDVGRLSAGMPAQITFDALHDQPALQGKLGDIPLYSHSEMGLALYDVPVLLETNELPALRPGMSANILVPLERKENVLVVPAEAVQNDGTDSYVWLLQGNSTQRHVVKLGVSDGTYTEVLEGLQEGDVVRVPLRSPSYDDVIFGKGG